VPLRIRAIAVLLLLLLLAFNPSRDTAPLLLFRPLRQ
jgi:hypothetical protein